MAKVKTSFVCSECGNISPKWEGKCQGCDNWNTYVEEIQYKETSREATRVWKDEGANKRTAKRLSEIETDVIQRLNTQDTELNRVLGGGIVPGSLVLVGGQPGIGKSTLLLQLAFKLHELVYYVSGEESDEQIKMRAERIDISGGDCYISTENNVSKMLKDVKKINPSVLIVDSIQTLYSPNIESTPGTVSQIRECSTELQQFAKETKIAIFVIGHITKDGAIAGPKLLEHIVDVVLHFEGDRNHIYRILRSHKNRFGPTDELGIYQMISKGLQGVENPSELLMSQKDGDLSGSAIAATIEGMRPMMIEIQALVTTAVFGQPQRTSTGFDLRRLSMLLAVLEKRSGLFFGRSDVFLNIAGGIKINDPALDLAIVTSLISSLEDVSVPQNYTFAAEIGLSGEIRAINRVDQRIKEAQRLGFERIYISKYNKGIVQKDFDIEIMLIGNIKEIYYDLFT